MSHWRTRIPLNFSFCVVGKGAWQILVEHLEWIAEEGDAFQKWPNGFLERHFTIQVILVAEIRYREGALRQYEWRVQRKAELEEEERKGKLEAESAEKER